MGAACPPSSILYRLDIHRPREYQTLKPHSLKHFAILGRLILGQTGSNRKRNTSNPEPGLIKGNLQQVGKGCYGLLT